MTGNAVNEPLKKFFLKKTLFITLHDDHSFLLLFPTNESVSKTHPLGKLLYLEVFATAGTSTYKQQPT